MEGPIMIFAYLGPETMLPMTSIVAGIAGVVLMLGRNSIRWLVAPFRLVASRIIGRLRRKVRSRGSRPVSIKTLRATSDA